MYCLHWMPSCLDRGALTNVDAPGCGTSVVQRFSSWGKVVYIYVTLPRLIQRGHPLIKE